MRLSGELDLQDYSNPQSLGSRFRARRLRYFLSMIDAVFDRQGHCTVLDLGGRRDYWSPDLEPFLRERRCRITLSNIEVCDPEDCGGIFEYKVEDACYLGYGDRQFNLIHSNSMIEHVGDWDRMARCAENIRRISEGYYIQTPCFWFPIEPHFFVLFFSVLPRPWQVKILMSRACGFYDRAQTVTEAMTALQSCQLLDRSMVAELFPDAAIQHERVAGLTKSLIAVRHPASAGAA